MTNPKHVVLDEPLPLRLPTLEHLPAPLHELYAQKFDGTFQLHYVAEGSREAMLYIEEIATGSLKVVRAGETVSTIAAAEAHAAAQNAAVDAEIRRIEEAELTARFAKERAAFDADAAKQRAALEAREKAMKLKYTPMLDRVPERTIPASDNRAFLANLEGIAKGTVRVESA
jgi:hypothetical protein